MKAPTPTETRRINRRASQVECPTDLPQLAVVLDAWHRADEAEDARNVDDVVRRYREARDERLIGRARAGTLRHVTQ